MKSPETPKGPAIAAPSETAPASVDPSEIISSEHFSELLTPLLADAQTLATGLLGPRRASYAEDVVQTSIVKAFTHRDSFTKGSNFRSWFLRIVHNTAISHHRHSKIRSHDSIESAAEEKIPLAIREVERSLTVEELLGELQEGQRIREAITQINPEALKTFLRVYVDGLTCDEAATELDIELGTVLSRLHRTRQAILKALQTRAPEIMEHHTNARKRTALDQAPKRRFKT